MPYNGEEVKLHWANADQYYIKSSEYFSNFTFTIGTEQLPMNRGQKQSSLKRVHFRVVEATEGEHGNVKASEQNKRFFIIHKQKPVEFLVGTDPHASPELVVNFEYRPDPEKTGQERAWQDKRNAEAVETVLRELGNLVGADPRVYPYLDLLNVPAPTDSDKKRPVLAKYINQYTARNTKDYFIHKDLGGFLRRELDFYIKNEVMRLDDIENAEAPAVESYLAKIRVMRKIAGKLIDFLAQLENFQKKLWLKKKFVIETNYCITLDRLSEVLYSEIAANDAQIEEWIKLFAIDEIRADLSNPGYSRPLTPEFLKANNKLVLDTRFFDEAFKARLLASIKNFDEQCDGLLIHSENFQALNLLQERYQKQVKCVYIDPPYNAQSSEILYKNSYKHASWITLMADRLCLGRPMLQANCSQVIAIDEVEQEVLGHIVGLVFQNWAKACISIVHNPRGQQGKNISYVHEFAYFIYPSDKIKCIADVRRTEIDSRNLRDSGTESDRTDARTCFYPIIIRDLQIVEIGEIPPDEFHPSSGNVQRSDGTIEIWPINESGDEKKWRYSLSSVESILDKLEIVKGRSVLQVLFHKDSGTMRSLWVSPKYDASEYGTKVLQSVLGADVAVKFSYPKSIHTVRETLIAQCSGYKSGIVLDYFAGSGTTGHAVINLNREDGGNRKYILVEMGDYFDTVLKPRIAKVVYSESWKDGKPTARHTGVSHCFKYLRLESYEDTLNNLRMDSSAVGANPRVRPHSGQAREPAPTEHSELIAARGKMLRSNPSLREDYMLRYLLDVETRGSQSLLNIDAFADPCAYTLDVKKPGTDEYATRSVDLIETFNYLIGLRVLHIALPQTFRAAFKRINDHNLPEDQDTKLVVDGKLRQDADGPWWFRKLEGWVPNDPANPNNGQREKVLVIWRKLTDDLEKDNLMLDEWFQSNRINTRDFEFDTIYVNGSNNLPNLKLDNEKWKVRLIEEEFMKCMWKGEGN